MRKIEVVFKYEIGDTITDFGRDLTIIDREIREKPTTRRGKPCTERRKWYKYKCNKCGNEDYVDEYDLNGSSHRGCNACFIGARKIIFGVNDITTTAPWMVKYFVDKEYPKTIAKYNNKKCKMICPDCGRIIETFPYRVCANKGLSCICGDGKSYPNKFMHSLLEQIGVCFESEKIFDWSEKKIYDNYIEYKGLKIITEQHGKQHYDKKFNNNSRSVEEEQLNDKRKMELALSNGIDHYFQLDCRESTMEHISKSIIESGLLDILCVDKDSINWLSCDEFASSNLAKTVCEYKKNNPMKTLHDIANDFHLGYITVQRYVKRGSKFGWCTYTVHEDRKLLDSQQRINHHWKPIHCITNGMYYNNARVACESLSTEDLKFSPRVLRQSIDRNSNYFKHKFEFVSKDEFENIKANHPELVIG